MRGIFTIAHLTFLEARRRLIVPAALGCGLLFLVIYAIAIFFVDRHVEAGFAQQRIELQFFTLAGLYAVNFLTIAVAVLLPVDTLSGEIASGVMQTIAAKPIDRGAIVAGKWLTHSAMTGAYLGFMAGGVIAIVFAFTGFTPPNVPTALPLMWLGAATMVSISIAGGVRLSTVTNGIVAFAFYGIAFIGGWVEQIAAFASNRAAQNIGTLISLLSPVEALWRRAAYQMQPPIMRDLQLTPFGSAVVPSNAMIGWAIGFVAVALAFAVWQFRRRPL